MKTTAAATTTSQTYPAREAAGRVAEGIRLTAEQARSIAEAEQVWRRMALHLLQKEDLARPMALGITSSIRGEGRTTSSIGLASALAHESGEPVLLVEADLSAPSIARTCLLAPAPGLSEFLIHRSTLDTALRATGLPNLTVAVAGESGRSGASVEPLTSPLRRRLPQLLTTWKESYRHIVMDLPAMLGDVNAEDMARQMDGCMLVVRAGVTPMEKVREAGRLLEGARLLSAIHIGQPSSMPRWVNQLLGE